MSTVDYLRRRGEDALARGNFRQSRAHVKVLLSHALYGASNDLERESAERAARELEISIRAAMPDWARAAAERMAPL